MTTTGAARIVTSASDIAAILDTVAPDAGTPLADTPIWNELAARWEAMQTRFRNLESGIAHTALPDQPVQAVQPAPASKPRPRSASRNTSRKSPNKAPTGSSTRRAANAPQAPTENVSAGTQPEAEP